MSKRVNKLMYKQMFSIIIMLKFLSKGFDTAISQSQYALLRNASIKHGQLHSIHQFAIFLQAGSQVAEEVVHGSWNS